MKYCLIGLMGIFSLSVSFLVTNSLSETAVKSINETVDVGQSQDAELYAGPYHCPRWRCPGGGG